MLFSQIGKSLVAIFSELLIVLKRVIFKYIEDGFRYDELATAIAITGLVEAHISTDANQHLWGNRGVVGSKI